MARLDDMNPAMRDLFVGGEGEEVQDFTPPSAQELPIERLPATEQAAGVEVAGLYAVVSDAGDGAQLIVQVSGEISATGGQTPDGLAVVAAVYDAAGRVLGTIEQHTFGPFPGWDPFSAVGYVLGPPATVRVFVRQARTWRKSADRRHLIPRRLVLHRTRSACTGLTLHRAIIRERYR